MSKSKMMGIVGDALRKRHYGVQLFLFALGLVSFLILSASVLQSSANAEEFTNLSIQGSWGFTASGTVMPPAVPAPTPAVAVGIMTFNGAGGCSFADTVNIGNIDGISGFRASSDCTYIVNPDGTGTISVKFEGDTARTPLSFVIVDHKKEIRFIRTDYAVGSGVARVQ